jgi:PKD repeat protein
VATSLPQYSFCTDTFAFDQPIRVVEPKAGFTSPDLSACAPSLVHFTNSSVDGDTYTWDFGDGSTSSSVSPTHLYKNPGVYSVSLVASSAYGCSDTLLRNQYIRVLGPVTRFSLSDTTGCLPLAVSFRDSSVDAVSWMWNFGDGSVDASQFPVHTYSDSGIYSVTLITTDTGGCTSFQQYPFRVHANPNPVAAWSSSDSSGCGSLTTYFTNRSSGFSSIWWDFGDGSFAITANPSHTYSSVGQYDITLTAYNRYGCTDTVFSPLAMRVQLPPVAAFTTSATQGCSPLTAFFTNLSHDTAGASYTWNLGNGVVSSAPSPVGTYVDPGLYSVSLTVTNANGCSDSTAMASLIHVLDTLPPPVSEILSVSVASDNSVDITWANNPATDLDRYVLYRLNENTGGYEVIYTDTNPANTSFALTSKHTDTGLQTLRHSYTYKLQTLDLCGNTIGLDQLRAHTTINVEARTEGFSVRVDWNAYGGCPVDHYDIYRASGSGAFQRIGSGPGDSLPGTLHLPYRRRQPLPAAV